MQKVSFIKDNIILRLMTAHDYFKTQGTNPCF